MRLLSLVLACGMALPSRAKARARADGGSRAPTPPPLKARRRARRAPLVATFESPCGRHRFEVVRGAIFVNGRQIHPDAPSVHILSAPAWRGDGDALAWLERDGAETRLLVLPTLVGSAEPLAWALPSALGADRVHFGGATRVVVGPELLQPHAVATWTD